MGWLDEVLKKLDMYAGGLNNKPTVPMAQPREYEVRTTNTSLDTVFDRAIDFVLKEEGGYVNDPNDPGKATNYGITSRDHPDVDVRNITKEEAKQIYYKEYWLPVRAVAEIHPKLAIALFDTGVNMGVGTSIRLMQKALGVAQDGRIGPATRARIESKRETIVPLFLGERMARYQTLPGWEHYRKGWTLRVIRLAMEVA